MPYDTTLTSLGITLWRVLDVVIEENTLPNSLLCVERGDEIVADYSSIIDEEGDVRFEDGELQGITELTISLRSLGVVM